MLLHDDALLSSPTIVYPARVRVLGVDYGRRRIGLALSDPTGLLARPWKAIQSGDSDVVSLLATEVARLAEEGDGLAAVVIGLPRRLGGEPSAHTADVERLAVTLRDRTRIPVVLQDERLSSREAESLLAERVKNWRQRKSLIDAMAAAVILQDYLDGRERRPAGAVEEDHP